MSDVSLKVAEDLLKRRLTIGRKVEKPDPEAISGDSKISDSVPGRLLVF